MTKTKTIQVSGACDECVAAFMAGNPGMTEEEARRWMTVGTSCYWCLCRKHDNGVFADPHPRCQICEEVKPCGCPVVKPAKADKAKEARK